MYINQQEYYRKRANIIEELKDCKIKLVYTKKPNFLLKDKPKKNISLPTYTVNIQTPNDPSIPTKTAVYHELSHVLWDSFMNGSFAILEKWAKETTLKLFHRKMIISQGSSTPTNIPNHIQHNVDDIQQEMNQYIQSIYKNCFNCLEDQRIESLTRQIWLATENMFDQAKNQLGQKLDDEILSPSEHLLAARFNRPELTNSNYIEAMKDVEETGKTGTITVMHKIKDLIDKDIQDRFENYFANLKGIVDDAKATTGGNNRPISSEYEDARKEFDKDSSSKMDVNDLMGKFILNQKAKSMEKPMQEQVSRTKQELLKIQEIHDKLIIKNTRTKLDVVNLRDENDALTRSSTITRIAEDGHYIVTPLDLNEVKKDGEREVNFVLEKIFANTPPKEPAHILTDYCRPLATPNPNKKIAAQLTKIFDKIKETKKIKISENGSEIDIEALLQAKSKGYGDFMVDEVRSNGLMILVTIDGSGSMQGENGISQARNLVATMFRSVESIPQVKILANVWSSDILGNVGITPVRIEEECNRINTDTITWTPEIDKFCWPAVGDGSPDGSGTFVYDNPADPHKYAMTFTPTHEALRYSGKQLAKYSGKKLLIMITDGYPQYYKNWKAFPEQTLVNLTMKEYRKAQRYCRNIMCINVSPDDGSRKNLKRIFKKNYVEFPGMDKASEFVLKSFRKAVTSTLRS